MQTILLVVQLLLAITLIAVIMIQRTAQDGGGLMGGGGGGTMGGLFTAKGSANVLTRTTALLATLFILNSLALGYIASSQHQSRDLVDQIKPVSAPAAQAPKSMPPATMPAQSKAPVAPSAPQAPQVPVAK